MVLIIVELTRVYIAKSIEKCSLYRVENIRWSCSKKLYAMTEKDKKKALEIQVYVISVT